MFYEFRVLRYHVHLYISDIRISYVRGLLVMTEETFESTNIITVIDSRAISRLQDRSDRRKNLDLRKYMKIYVVENNEIVWSGFRPKRKPGSTIIRADATELTRGISNRSVSIRNYRAFLRSQQRRARLERDDRHGAKFNESRLTGVSVTPRNRIRWALREGKSPRLGSIPSVVCNLDWSRLVKNGLSVPWDRRRVYSRVGVISGVHTLLKIRAAHVTGSGQSRGSLSTIVLAYAVSLDIGSPWNIVTTRHYRE